VRIRVTERAQAIVIFLSSRIPKGEFDALVINFDIRDVVLKDSGYINLLIHRAAVIGGVGMLADVQNAQQVAVNDVMRIGHGEMATGK
jgi:hypothetical protein